jgi:phytoene dehydrogenase-like protein
METNRRKMVAGRRKMDTDLLGVFVPYRMPIAGLYQTGGSTAPGGSVTGQPGRNAAIAMLQDDGKSLEQVLGKPPRP